MHLSAELAHKLKQISQLDVKRNRASHLDTIQL